MIAFDPLLTFWTRPLCSGCGPSPPQAEHTLTTTKLRAAVAYYAALDVTIKRLLTDRIGLPLQGVAHCLP